MICPACGFVQGEGAILAEGAQYLCQNCKAYWPITPDIDADQERKKEIKYEFLSLWTKAKDSPDYDKSLWNKFRSTLSKLLGGYDV